MTGGELGMTGGEVGMTGGEVGMTHNLVIQREQSEPKDLRAEWLPKATS